MQLNLKQARDALLDWYDNNGRKDLPWRKTNDPYPIYVSEIMLQQTQVKTVLERFYFPFLKAFPTLEALANASEEDVLKRWQGLGYYNRAINMHRAAKISAPVLPTTPDILEQLPGIGKNTAHAIAAFAFHQPVPVMEANVKRVLSRIFALKDPKIPELWEKAHMLLDKNKPFDYNQAMMDVGAMVCTPKAPHCSDCPFNTICLGQEAPESYPAPKTKKATPVRKRVIALVMNKEGKFLVERRTTRFLNGLYQFPTFMKNSELQKTFQTTHSIRKIGSVNQTYSHFKLDADIYYLKVDDTRKGQWHTLESFSRLPHSGAEEKIIQLIKTRPDLLSASQPK